MTFDSMDGQAKNALPARARAAARDYAIYALKLVVAALLLAVAVALVDFPTSMRLLKNADNILVFHAFTTCLVGTIILPSLITHQAIGDSFEHLTKLRLILINFSIRFYGMILPRPVSVAIRWHRYGGGRFTAESLALMLYERLAQMAVMLLLTLVAIIIDDRLPEDARWVLLSVTVVGTAVTSIAMAAFMSRTVQGLAATINERLSPLLPERISAALARSISAAEVYRSLPRKQSFNIFSLSLGAALLFTYSAWLAAWAIDLNLSFVSLIWIRSLVFLITLLPISVAGIGLRELSSVGLMGLIGIPAPTALAFSLLNFLLQLGQAAIGAVIELIRYFLPKTPVPDGYGNKLSV